MSTFKQLCDLEWTLGRALGAARTFADADTCIQLNEVQTIFNEIRHAALHLCDPATDETLRAVVIERLLTIFKQ